MLVLTVSAGAGHAQKGEKRSAKRRASAAQHADALRAKTKSPGKATNPASQNQGPGADQKGVTAG